MYSLLICAVWRIVLCHAWNKKGGDYLVFVVFLLYLGPPLAIIGEHVSDIQREERIRDFEFSGRELLYSISVSSMFKRHHYPLPLIGIGLIYRYYVPYFPLRERDRSSKVWTIRR